MIPSKTTYQEAVARVTPEVHQTSVLTSRLLNELVGADLYFKCENFQKMGAFKMRGAVNAILSLSKEDQDKGVVTHSSGNFGQAVALAAKNLGVTAHIVMPKNAPQIKKNAVKAYGGLITECDNTLDAREQTSADIHKSTGATFLHPSNQIEVILGNASAGHELLTDQPHLDYIFTPVGGGGLIAGTAIAAHYHAHNTKVIGGEPSEVDDAYRSLQSGKIEKNETSNTIADGLRTALGDVNFPIIQELVQEIILVEEDEIIEAMRLIWERLKIIIEPSCAVPFAALLKRKADFKGTSIGLILSGGNVDLNNLPF
jgi:threonine dehydratase